MNALCQVVLVVLKKIFKLQKYISTILTLSPLEIGYHPSVEQIKISLTQECFISSFVEIGPSVLERKIFKCCQCIFAILKFSPLGNGLCSSFEQT